MERVSGVEVGDQAAFDAGNGVFKQQLALLQAGELELVPADGGGQMVDGGIEVAVLDLELGQPFVQFGGILDLHGIGRAEGEGHSVTPGGVPRSGYNRGPPLPNTAEACPPFQTPPVSRPTKPASSPSACAARSARRSPTTA